MLGRVSDTSRARGALPPECHRVSVRLTADDLLIRLLFR